MGNTILQTMPKTFDGLRLFESFEAATFMEDQDWTLLFGVPSISPNAAIQGLKSFIMDLTYPLISHTLSSATWTAVYFYDDATVTTGGFTPGVVWVDSLARVWGVGVEQAVSTTHYMKNLNGVKSASSVARTTGWHKMTMGVVAGNWVMAIDGVTCNSFAVSTITMVTIKIGAQASSGTNAFGFFDWVQVAGGNVTVANAPASGTIQIYSSTGTLLASGTGTNVNVTALNFPFDGYLRMLDASGRPIYNGYLRSLSGGDALAYKTMDFGRRASSLAFKPTAVRTDKFSLGGQDQSMFFNARDAVGLTMAHLTNDQAQQLTEFWQDLQRGEYCSLAIDSDNVYSGTLAGWTYGASTLTLGPDTAGIGKGAALRVVTQTRAGQTVQKVSAVNSTTVVALTTLLQLANGFNGLVFSQYYWPVMKCSDQALGLSLDNVRLKRWNLLMNLVEVIE